MGVIELTEDFDYKKALTNGQAKNISHETYL
jgi:hypothetical protein